MVMNTLGSISLHLDESWGVVEWRESLKFYGRYDDHRATGPYG